MRDQLLCATAAALACVLGSSKPAHAGPGVASAVDLSLRPSELARVERHRDALDLSPSTPIAEPAGQYIGPVWIGSEYTKSFSRLPRPLRRELTSPVGPWVTTVQSIHLRSEPGPGMYARF